MKRKAEEELGKLGEKRSKYGDGVEWVREELIGKGSFGSVFLALSKRSIWELGEKTPGFMAVKSATFSASESLLNEAEVLCNIKGCHYVIEYYGEEVTKSDEGEKVYNLILEFASGGTLGDLIRNSGTRGLPESVVRKITRDIIEGVKHIHKCGYVHCDLKPDNILLVPTSTTSGSDTFVAKVADFGLSKRTKEKVDGWRGTLMYLSPEVLFNNLQDQSSDIWAVGCIVLKMLTGKPPWDLKPLMDLEDLLDLIVDQSCTPNIPAEVSDLGRDFLKKCLAVNSEDILTAENLLKHPFVAQSQTLEADRRQTVMVPRIQPLPAGFAIPVGL